MENICGAGQTKKYSYCIEDELNIDADTADKHVSAMFKLGIILNE